MKKFCFAIGSVFILPHVLFYMLTKANGVI